jgi:hypothetical protein
MPQLSADCKNIVNSSSPMLVGDVVVVSLCSIDAMELAIQEQL